MYKTQHFAYITDLTTFLNEYNIAPKNIIHIEHYASFQFLTYYTE